MGLSLASKQFEISCFFIKSQLRFDVTDVINVNGLLRLA